MKLSDIKQGDVLVADKGFTCMEAGMHSVRKNSKGELFIHCEDGEHLLSGQMDDDEGKLVGLRWPIAKDKKGWKRWSMDIHYVTDRPSEYVALEELGDLDDHIEHSGVNWNEIACINITLNRRTWPVGRPDDETQ